MSNLPKTTGSELNGAVLVFRCQPEQGQRNANVVMQVDLSCQSAAHLFKNGRGQLTHRGLAAAASHCKQLCVALSPVTGRPARQRRHRISDHQLRQGHGFISYIDNGSNRALSLCLLKELMAIKAVASQCYKQLPVTDATGICRHAVKPHCGRINRITSETGLEPVTGFRK